MRELTHEEKNLIRIVILIVVIVVLVIIVLIFGSPPQANRPPITRPPDPHMSPF